jgi:hypothetical protein
LREAIAGYKLNIVPAKHFPPSADEHLKQWRFMAMRWREAARLPQIRSNSWHKHEQRQSQ